MKRKTRFELNALRNRRRDEFNTEEKTCFDDALLTLLLTADLTDNGLIEETRSIWLKVWDMRTERVEKQQKRVE